MNNGEYDNEDRNEKFRNRVLNEDSLELDS